jgi:hypothetical protein
MNSSTITLTADELRWLDGWTALAAYNSPEEGVLEVLKTCGAIPRGSEYFKQRFSFAEG